MAHNISDTPSLPMATNVSLPPGPDHRPNPLARQPARIMDFGHNDSTSRIYDITMNIANQDTISGLTFDQLHQLTAVDAPMTRDQFIRTWKTLILHRVQILQGNELSAPLAHFHDFATDTKVPATLGDLLHRLGQFKSSTDGRTYNLLAPPQPDQLPDWWNIDANLFHHWNQYMARMETKYLMTTYPHPLKTEGTALITTTIQDAQAYRSVRTITSEADPDDGYVRFVNDDIFYPNDHTTYATSDYYMIRELHHDTTVANYIAAYRTT